MSDIPKVFATTDPEALAHPQPLLKMLRDATPVLVVEGSPTVAVVSRYEDVREVLRNTDVFSSGVDAVSIGQVRPLIPLQIDPPQHKNYRKILDPIFAPKRVALLEDATRKLARDLVSAVADNGSCNFHAAVAEPFPSTVFLQLLGLPVSRATEFIALKDGIIRPSGPPSERQARVNATGQRIYAVLEEVLEARTAQREDDFVSGFLDAEVDGHRLTHDEVIDICYLFFLAGLDTVTASLDCFVAYLAQHPDQRKRIVEDPGVIPHAIEEMLRWESPVASVARITTQATEVSGCPIPAGAMVPVMLGSANTDERAWPEADTVDFDRDANKHIAFGGGAHRCLGSHLARMELRVAVEEWHARVPDYSLAEGIELQYSFGLRSVENLELVW